LVWCGFAQDLALWAVDGLEVAKRVKDIKAEMQADPEAGLRSL
jgi:hypothetical protein